MHFEMGDLLTWPKILAVEMEGAGVGNAIEYIHALGKVVSFLMIRGISDVPQPHASISVDNSNVCGTKERDLWKAYAGH
jgi:nucleoside phosphorylase